ncbi:MAG: alpha/beta hydrolase [Woeseiaceae bacterium]|nr:alpha/beta hydrolase [Woeseiaceae bacterium]
MAAHREHTYMSRDGLTLFYREYGESEGGVPVVCLPGITRNSRDFEDIAAHLAQHHRVLAPDLRGRGFSEHDSNWRNYHPQTYVDDVMSLLDHRKIDRVILLGTSLGGLVSTVLTKQHGERVVAVILNDIGPEVGAAGLERIKTYIGRMPPVASWDEAVAQARDIYGHAMPGLSNEEWRRLVRRGYREDEHGVPRLDMDPAIGDAARKVGAELEDPWVLFSGLDEKPLLVIQGELSDILTDDIVERMRARKPDLEHVKVANRGHPPLLDEPECIAAIDSFIRDANAR